MKRLVLISMVTGAILWIAYASFELWFNTENQVDPKNVFHEVDQSVLLINNLEETLSSGYLDVVRANPYYTTILSLDENEFKDIKIYASGIRPIVIFEKENKWKEVEIQNLSSKFKLVDTKVNSEGVFLMISQGSQERSKDLLDFYRDADKKASANFWVKSGEDWSRTDMYNLNNGFYEYRSSAPDARYGEAVRDIPLFTSVIPYTSTSYRFFERFYAAEIDSVFEAGPMNSWVDRGFVEVDYEGALVLISDYRSQQTPSLVLIEQTEDEETIELLDEIYSFKGFQLTADFPTKHNGRFYILEIEDKVLLTESKSVAQKLMVDYQLGRTLSLNPERENQFFGGLPSHVNSRFVSVDEKSSLTWKDHLLFEVSTRPPSGKMAAEESKTSWSASVGSASFNLVPIPDHLRNGVSVLTYSENGKYSLISPNGKELWKGDLGSAIQGEVRVIDVFDNQKHQFLLKTKRKIHLLDLNGNEVGGFPYNSSAELTSGISEFVWNGTKRFLVGNEKGEIVMLNSSGLELNIIQVGSKSIISTPFALNIKGNLRAWAVNTDRQEYLGYLETPAKAQLLGKASVDGAIKYNGRVLRYFEKEGQVYCQKSDINGGVDGDPIPVEKGKVVSLTQDHIIVSNLNSVSVFDHSLNLLSSKTLPFNEVGAFVYLKDKKESIVLDYLQNKIHAYSNAGEELPGFPKEGREVLEVGYDKANKQVYIYSKVAQSIICYKY